MGLIGGGTMGPWIPERVKRVEKIWSLDSCSDYLGGEMCALDSMKCCVGEDIVHSGHLSIIWRHYVL